MSNYKESLEQSKDLWDELAKDWDERMGENDNEYHRRIIRPATLKFLNPQAGQTILDVACGNGNFSRILAKLGVKVTAFDFSSKMIDHAKDRCRDWLDKIDFHVVDAANYQELMKLKTDKPFDKVVSNMAVMDIADIEPLFFAAFDLLKADGIFVFSGVHPCFQTPNMRKFVEVNDYTGEYSVRMGIQTYEYIEPKMHRVLSLKNNSKQVLHFHRPLSMILNMCFKVGFVLDGIEEPVFKKLENATQFDWYEIPPSIILRLRKV